MMLYCVLLQPNKPLYLSGFSRGAYAAMIAASVLHTLTGIRPLLIVGEPVIGHTALMPRRGLHELVINVLVSEVDTSSKERNHSNTRTRTPTRTTIHIR